MTLFNSNFGKFVLILLAGNALLIGFYFSGVSALQQIIAPTIEGLVFSQWREFGLMETIQNALLLAIIIILLLAAIRHRYPLEKLLYCIALALFTFLFLEEIDYGLHYYEYLTGESSNVETRNWHNQWNDGLENATKLKRATDAVNILWFFLVPLLTFIAPIQRKLNTIPIIPSRWFIAGFLIALFCSKFAHYLDDQGLATINGIPGNLASTIAEFRETSVYYLYLLYALQITKHPRLLYSASE